MTRKYFIRCPRCLLPIEQVTLFLIIFTAALYLGFGVPLRHKLHRLYVIQCMYGLDAYLIALLIVLLVHVSIGLRGESGEGNRLSGAWNAFSSKYLALATIGIHLRTIHALIVVLVCFGYLKHLIPFVHPGVFDHFFLRTEGFFFGGRPLSAYVVRFFGSESAKWMSAGYTAFYPYMSALICFVVFTASRRDLQWFAVAFTLVWVFGVFTVYLVPTWGPCFFVPEFFLGLPDTPVKEIQNSLWAMKQHVTKHPYESHELFAISGFPSLHIAIVWLGTLTLYRVSRTIAALSAIFLALTFITTLYFGWHYLLDNLGAIPLVWLAMICADRVIAASDPPPLS